MAELPRGTVTFVFTDIEGSTALAKRLRDRYGEVLEQHQLLLRAAFAAHGGHEIDTQGDSFFFAFARARDAVLAVVEAQRALTGHEWPEGGEVRVRMGLHTGEPAVGEQRYTGFGVHRAARISAVGHGGQVLLSNATRELIEDDLPEKRLHQRPRYLPAEGHRPARAPLPARRRRSPERVSAAQGREDRRAAPTATSRDPALCTRRRDRCGRRDPHLRAR